MKSSSFVRVAVLTLLAVFVPVVSQAATYPLSQPYGLALDSSGNLYVANTGGNDILVYNPSHVQIRRTTQGIQSPTGVAIDPSGNLWVANAASNSITEYGPAGKQLTVPGTVFGINNPQAIAVDGLYNIWVENNFTDVAVFPYQAGRMLDATFGGATVTGVAVYKDLFAVGGNSNYFSNFIPEFLVNEIYQADGLGCFSVAYDGAGSLHCGTLNDTVVEILPTGAPQLLINLPFFPYGMAIDSTRGFIYISDGVGNKIAVYSTSGTLLHTIQ